MTTTNLQMPAEYKAKWIAALRSGEYKQGRGKMYNKEDDSYCCLGVLQKVLDGDKQIGCGYPTLEWSRTKNMSQFHSFHINPANSAQYLSTYHRLAIKNDFPGENFLSIADRIDTNVEGV